MSALHAEIRAALDKHGALTCSELAKHCPAAEGDRQIVARNIAGLRAKLFVKGTGLESGEVVYDIDAWPAGADTSGPPPRTAMPSLQEIRRAIDQATSGPVSIGAPQSVETPQPQGDTM